MKRRTALIIVIVAALPAVAGLIAWLVETDQEAIERVTEACRRSLLRGDAEAIEGRLTPDAKAEGLIGRGPLAKRVRFWVSQAKGRLEGVNLSLRKIVVEGDGAHAEWVAWIRAKPGEMVRRAEFLVTLDYRREPGGWRIARADASMGSF